MEKLTREQIERLKQTDAKAYYDHARYFYVQDIEYYKEFFEQDIKRRNEIEKKKKKNFGLIVAGCIGVIIFMFVVLAIFKGEDSGSVKNSEWDGSVKQCKTYLMDRIRDPDSYESIEWSKPVQGKNGNYLVRHKYRAKNGFGGYVISTVLFLVADDGKVVSMESVD